MIIYVCFLIFDGIVLCSSHPIKTTMITEPEGPDLGITTNLNSSEHFVTSNLTETNSKSRRSKKFLISHQCHTNTKRSLSERSIKVDNAIEANSKSRRSKRSLPSHQLHSVKILSKHVSRRSIKAYSNDVVEAKSRISKRSLVSNHNHAKRSYTNNVKGRSIKVDSSNINEAKPKRFKRSSFHVHVKRSLPERSIKVDSTNTNSSSISRKSLSERSINVDSSNITDTNRSKRSLFHVHGRRSISEHSSGRSTTKVEQRNDDSPDKARKKRLKDGNNGTPLRRGKRGSMYPQPYDGNILLTVQLFLLFVPLASAVALSVVPWTSDDDDSTSTWGPSGDYCAFAKDENADVADEFVLNRINGADPLSKRLKLERILGHQCPCLYDPSTSDGTNKPAKSSTRWGSYAALVAVAVLIAFLVHRIVLIVS